MFPSWRSHGPARTRQQRRLFRPGVERLEDRLAPAAVVTLQNPPAGIFPQVAFVDPHPTVGGDFGATVTALSTGNVVITNPNDNLGGIDAGAVYLFNGLTGALISTLTGSHANDQIGSGGVTVLSNGNFVVASSSWNSNVGAATWGSGTIGVSGVVGAANSIVGSATDYVSSGGVTALTNGNYVVRSPGWNASFGAATWGNGSTGTSETVSAANSIVGSTNGDGVGDGVTALTNGNFVVSSPSWNGFDGAATWGNGSTGQSATGFGTVSDLNSIVGSTNGDGVGGALTTLINGNYLVSSSGVTPLTNGNFVVSSPGWQLSGYDAGAATWGNGSTGTFGAVGITNSIIGAHYAGDSFGDEVSSGGVTALSNGNFVVSSPNSQGFVVSSFGGYVGTLGAATWGNGSTGTVETVLPTNSIVGSTGNDFVSNGGVTGLSNGNFVVDSFMWNGGGIELGAATWGNGSTGQTLDGFGAVSAANSIVGSINHDVVGLNGVTALSNGNFVVRSFDWTGSGAFFVGAATWGNGSTGTFETVSAANSIVGSTNGDSVASGGVTALSDGNFVVSTPGWQSGGNRVGAATWGNGSTGQSATGSAANSIVGSSNFDYVSNGGVTALSNGNFVVSSPNWQNGLNQVGAATWGNGSTGTFETVSAANSIVGSTNGDQVGSNGVTALSNGNFVVSTPGWQSGGNAVGAVTWGNGSTGQTLDGSFTIEAQNSLLGQTSPSGLAGVVKDAVNQDFLVPFATDNNSGRVVAGFTDPNLLTFARGGSQTIIVTPAFVAGPLAGGNPITVQATTTLTVTDPLTFTGSGALTLQSQGSLLVNAPITTANGNLTLNAPIITPAAGLTLSTGSGVVTFTGGTLALGGSTPTTLSVNGGLAFTASLTDDVRLNGPTAGSGFDQISASGGVNLGGATLNISLGFTPSVGQSFELINNQGATAVVGTFAGLAEGAFLTLNGQSFQVSYKGGDGNDVVLTRMNPPTSPTPPPSQIPLPFVSVSFVASANGVLAPIGQEVLVLVSSTGVLTQSDATGGHQLATGVKSASVAFGAPGEVLVVVFQNGQLFQFDAAGTHFLASGILSATVAFTPSGTQEVLEVVLANGTLVQFDAAGAHQLATGVRSASVAFGSIGEVMDLVFQTGQLVQIDPAGAHVLANNVDSAAVALSSVGLEVLDVIFTDNSLWQFDATGGHKLAASV